MRKPMLSLAITMVALPLALSATAAANTVRIEVVTDHETFLWAPATTKCGFPITLTLDGSYKVADYFDNDGVLVKEIATPAGGPFTVTATNPATGKTVTTHASTEVNVLTFNPDGSIASSSISGISFNFVVPGAGALFQAVGRIVLPGGHPPASLIAGQHDFLSNNIAAFCDYMAGP